MRIVVVGLGKVGRVLTAQLAAQKHDIVVIDQNPDLIESIVNICDVRGVVGNGGCYDVQKDAFEGGAKKARYTAHNCVYPQPGV